MNNYSAQSPQLIDMMRRIRVDGRLRVTVIKPGMNALQIKTILWKRGLTITDIAREIELEYDATFDSLRTMLTGLFYRGEYNSKLADLVEEKYGIKIARPHTQTVREALQKAA